MNANKTITATFDNVYTITATAGVNGWITPFGVTTVFQGDSLRYTIEPNPCSKVADVLVDSVSVGAVTCYTFRNVSANHTIRAIFANRCEQPGQTQVTMNPGWNLISIPRCVSDYSVTTVFPRKLQDACSYNMARQRYDTQQTMTNGVGYWVLYPTLSVITMIGCEPGALTVNVHRAGWVLIGSRATPVPASSLQLNNGAEIVGDVFSYEPISMKYQKTTVINPGDACWILVTKACTVTIP
jgi:hypothetical protein